MRSIFTAVALAWAGASMASAQTSRPPSELLDRITGRWVLEGTIAGKTTTHDVLASWVLNRQYVQLHEVSLEQDAQGRPAYEAFVYLTWEPSRGEYSCLWLDSTSNAGLSNGVLGRRSRLVTSSDSSSSTRTGAPSTRHSHTTGRQTTGNGRWTGRRRANSCHSRA